MKMSTRGRYGLKAMIDIAVFGENKPISIKSISERQNLSENYLEQLIKNLKATHLLKSVRGAFGGYTLGKPAESISAGDILRAVEGPLSPVSCIEKNTHNCGDSCERCVSKTVWKKLYDGINEAADSITLKELAADYKSLNHINE